MAKFPDLCGRGAAAAASVSTVSEEACELVSLGGEGRGREVGVHGGRVAAPGWFLPSVLNKCLDVVVDMVFHCPSTAVVG